MEKDTSMLFIGIFCSLFVIMFIYSIISTRRTNAKEKAKRGRAQAKVIRYEIVRRSIVKQDKAYEPVLAYIVDGQPYLVQYNKGFGDPKKYRLGDTITICYDEHFPEDIYIPGDDMTKGDISVFVFGVITCTYLAIVALGEYFFGVNLRFWEYMK